MVPPPVAGLLTIYVQDYYLHFQSPYFFSADFARKCQRMPCFPVRFLAGGVAIWIFEIHTSGSYECGITPTEEPLTIPIEP
jgi:hypothetical protein